VYRVKKEGAFGGYKVLSTVLWHTCGRRIVYGMTIRSEFFALRCCINL
jgi:hypothetical protein